MDEKIFVESDVYGNGIIIVNITQQRSYPGRGVEQHTIARLVMDT